MWLKIEKNDSISGSTDERINGSWFLMHGIQASHATVILSEHRSLTTQIGYNIDRLQHRSVT